MHHLARWLILARRNGLSSSTVGKVGGWHGDDSLCRCSDLLARSVPIPKEVEETALAVAMPGFGPLFSPRRGAFAKSMSSMGFKLQGN